MNSVPIRELVERSRQCNPRELGRHDFVYIDISSVDRETKGIVGSEGIRSADAPRRARKQVHACDVILSTVRPNLNAVAFVPRELDRQIASTGFAVLRAKASALDPSYLFYFLQTEALVSHLTRIANGASYPAISDDDVLDAPIPLPDLAKQKRTAAILERADRLRRLRRFAVELGSTILLAEFLEMFGDPVLNPKGWKRARIQDLGDVKTGNTPPRENSENYGPGMEWIKSDNITMEELHPSRATEQLSARGVQLGRVVGPGSLLVTCIAGSATSIGNVALMDRKVAFNQQINAVTPGSEVVPLFLFGLLLTAKPLVQRSTTLGMKRIITKGNFEQLLLIRPPIGLQERFAQFVERLESLRHGHRESMRH